MADTPEKAKQGRKKGNLLFNLFLFLLDIALTLFLFVMPLLTAGAYGNFALHEYIFGVLYVIARIILSKVKQSRTTDILYLILRIIGIAGVAVYYVMLFNFGDYFSWFYPVRKSVYIAGNYSDAAYFDFLPEKLPEKTDNYFMSFKPPIAADAPSIDVHFYTDAAGTAEMRESALSHGIVLQEEKPEDILSNNAHPLMKSEPGQPSDLSEAEIYRLREGDGTDVIYLIDERTGYCRVFWTG
ncbi:MAG: hypothetical protein IJT87_12265 [Ruminiclostridium sp.]|nr:hypothetical protein [Ruminiclostridium sp.]